MTYDPSKQRRQGHVPDLPDAIDERTAEATRKRRRGHLAERSGYGMRTTSTGAGSGEPGSGGPATGDDFHTFYVKGNGTEDGVQTGHFIDGARVAFDLENTDGDVEPVPESMVLAINGQLMRQGAGRDFTISGNTITFVNAPPGGEMYGSCAIENITV